jgi:hypothetical protein
MPRIRCHGCGMHRTEWTAVCFISFGEGRAPARPVLCRTVVPPRANSTTYVARPPPGLSPRHRTTAAARAPHARPRPTPTRPSTARSHARATPAARGYNHPGGPSSAGECTLCCDSGVSDANVASGSERLRNGERGMRCCCRTCASTAPTACTSTAVYVRGVPIAPCASSSATRSTPGLCAQFSSTHHADGRCVWRRAPSPASRPLSDRRRHGRTARLGLQVYSHDSRRRGGGEGAARVPYGRGANGREERQGRTSGDGWLYTRQSAAAERTLQAPGFSESTCLPAARHAAMASAMTGMGSTRSITRTVSSSSTCSSLTLRDSLRG